MHWPNESRAWAQPESGGMLVMLQLLNYSAWCAAHMFIGLHVWVRLQTALHALFKTNIVVKMGMPAMQAGLKGPTLWLKPVDVVHRLA